MRRLSTSISQHGDFWAQNVHGHTRRYVKFQVFDGIEVVRQDDWYRLTRVQYMEIKELVKQKFGKVEFPAPYKHTQSPSIPASQSSTVISS